MNVVIQRVPRCRLAVTHLEDKFSKSIWVFVIEKEGVAGVGGCGLEEEQEELVLGRTGLKQAEQQLQQTAQLQYTIHTLQYTYNMLRQEHLANKKN